MKNLELTTDQYTALLKMMFLGFDVCLQSSETPDEMAELTILKDYICSFRNDFGVKDMIEYSKKFNQYSVSRELFDELNQIMKKYNRDIMYEELSDALAERDMKRKYSNPELKMMTEKERLKIENKIAEKYWDEFILSGVEKVKVDLR